MQIGNTDLGKLPVLLAPMEDVTDIGFRTLCRKMGASMVYSEFVSCDALTRSVKSTLLKLKVNAEERPVAIQIYGKDPDAMAEAAKIVEEGLQLAPDELKNVNGEYTNVEQEMRDAYKTMDPLGFNVGI